MVLCASFGAVLHLRQSVRYQQRVFAFEHLGNLDQKLICVVSFPTYYDYKDPKCFSSMCLPPAVRGFSIYYSRNGITCGGFYMPLLQSSVSRNATALVACSRVGRIIKSWCKKDVYLESV
jgi:hypothetical protein